MANKEKPNSQEPDKNRPLLIGIFAALVAIFLLLCCGSAGWIGYKWYANKKAEERLQEDMKAVIP